MNRQKDAQRLYDKTIEEYKIKWYYDEVRAESIERMINR